MIHQLSKFEPLQEKEYSALAMTLWPQSRQVTNVISQFSVLIEETIDGSAGKAEIKRRDQYNSSRSLNLLPELIAVANINGVF